MTDNHGAVLLIIGNEILSGRTQDTNTPWIANKLAERGIRLLEVRVVPDIEERIVEALHELRGKAQYVFTTGGIGPTHDDITTQSVARALNLPIVLDPKAKDVLLEFYGSQDQLTSARLKMAHVPSGAVLVPNPVSGAPGYRIENVFVLAGVPRIMQSMLDHILPELQFGVPILSNTVTCNLMESTIAEKLAKIQDCYDDVEIGSYPHFRSGELGLSVVLRSPENDSLHKATIEVFDLIKSCDGKTHAVSIKSHGEGTF
ncbi:MAG: competence/damage-inducible protein A [Alphaproteobacteria bacterium]|jgi:molybdenum cofactor synthesis domain-containing protein|nr:competence/damage-inducible protein A [Alphaproteobacteria bacterium]